MKRASEYIRICWLHTKLKDGGVSKKDYYDEFETSERTFQRDLDRLRDQLNAPVEYIPEKKKHIYTDTTYELPLMMLNEQELFALLISSKVLAGYENTPIYSTLQKIYRKFGEQLGTELSYLYDINNSGTNEIRSFNWHYLQQLISAINNKLEVEMVYESLNSGTTEKRTVVPVHIYNYDGDFYLVAYCKKRTAFRDFLLARVHEITTTDIVNKSIHFKPEDYFSQSQWGILKGIQVEHVTFTIPTDKELLLKEYFDTKIQKVEIASPDRVRYTCTVYPTNDFLNWAVAFEKDMVIEKPEWIRKKIIVHCKKILKTYE